MGLTKNVDFETAKLLKEKGFDLPTQKYYEYALKSKKDKQDGYLGSFGWKKGELYLQSGYFQNNNKSDFTSEMWYMCSAPPIADIVMWLYEIHGIWISATPVGKRFRYEIIPMEEQEKFEYSSFDYNSPTEAYLESINYTLKNLIK